MHLDKSHGAIGTMKPQERETETIFNQFKAHGHKRERVGEFNAVSFDSNSGRSRRVKLT